MRRPTPASPREPADDALGAGGRSGRHAARRRRRGRRARHWRRCPTSARPRPAALTAAEQQALETLLRDGRGRAHVMTAPAWPAPPGRGDGRPSWRPGCSRPRARPRRRRPTILPTLRPGGDPAAVRRLPGDGGAAARWASRTRQYPPFLTRLRGAAGDPPPASAGPQPAARRARPDDGAEGARPTRRRSASGWRRCRSSSRAAAPRTRKAYDRAGRAARSAAAGPLPGVRGADRAAQARADAAGPPERPAEPAPGPPAPRSSGAVRPHGGRMEVTLPASLHSTCAPESCPVP